MAILKNSELLAIKPEAVAGVFETTVTTDDVRFRAREISFEDEIDRDDEKSKFATGTWHGADESIVGQLKAKIGLSMKVTAGEFTPATVPATPTDAKHVLEFGEFFNSCGMKKLSVGLSATNNAVGTHVFYPSQTESEKTVSACYVAYDGEDDEFTLRKAAGAIGNFGITAEGTAKPFMIKFDYSGKLEAPENRAGNADVPKLAADFVQRTVADSLRNTTVKFTDLKSGDESSFCITSIDFQSGNNIIPIECQNTESGIKNFVIDGIEPTFVLNPLLKSLSAFDWFKAISTETFYKIEFDSEFFSIFIARAQINAQTIEDANGILRNKMTARALVNIDGDSPLWIPTPSIPANVSEIPYFIGFKEKIADY